MATRREGPYVWVTWLAKLMAGEINCEWAIWFKTHYTKWDKPPSDFPQTEWQMAHTQLSRETRAACMAAGEQVSIENQNTFYWNRAGSKLVISGKPDLVSIGDKVVTVIDCKTGQPKVSDQIQVLLYMYCLPKEAPVYRTHLLQGRVEYQGGNNVYIPPTALDAKFEERLNYYLDILDTATPAIRVPSAMECRFCDITKADCSDRIEPASDAPTDTPWE